ncbi:MAG: cadmium-translocating P-type ATPase [Bacteroidales bacterium]|nr:cadmium-translocating P-type ATPase [Bacteroidales bacterium]
MEKLHHTDHHCECHVHHEEHSEHHHGAHEDHNHGDHGHDCECHGHQEAHEEHHHGHDCECHGHQEAHEEHHHDHDCDCHGHQEAHEEHHHDHDCDCHEGHHHHGHEHHHHHHHGEEEGHGRLVKIIVASVLLVAAWLIERNTPSWATWQHLLIFLVPYLIVGFDTLKEAAEGLLHGEALSEDFLMSIATLGALAIGFMPGAESQFPEAVFVMLFFQVGELFEEMAEGRSRKSIEHLMDIRPDSARVERDGKLTVVKPEDVTPGEIILIQPGEKVPMDGVVLEGTSSLDTVALTGESVPRSIGPDDEILSGCVNLTGVLRVRTTRAFGESTAAKILDLVENAAESKSRSESFITKFARIYTPIVVALAMLVAVIPGLITGEWVTWIYRGLLFLVVSCPCALVISVPLTFFGGLGGASRKGILIKGSNLMDTLARVKTVVFDKTGTLTEGVFEVTAVHPEVVDSKELLHLAAHVERHSTHPIAMALRNAYPDEADDCEVGSIEETAGHGVRAVVNGRKIAVGNSQLMEAEGAAWHPCHHSGTIIHVAIDGVYAGHIVISDRIKADSASAIEALKAAGVQETVMLTGDQESVAAAVASALKLDRYHAELLPADKVSRVEALLPDGPLAFVGDGINDAPVLTRADVGIAMGALGSDAAIEAADVVLMDDKPSKIATAIGIARRTIRIARENIWFAIGIKVLVLVLATLGLATMWMAVFADVGVTVLAVLNAMRALKA